MPIYGALLEARLEKSDTPGMVDSIYGALLDLHIEKTEPPVGGISGHLLFLSARIAEVDMINPITPQSVKSGEAFTIQATLMDGTDADSWTFTQQSGPTASMSGTGASRTFIGPATTAGATLQFSVTALKAGISATPVSFFITLYPHQWWVRSENGWDPIHTSHELLP